MAMALLAPACAHVAGTVFLEEPDPIGIRLPEGTELVYQRISATAETSIASGTITYRVAEIVRIEPRVIVDELTSAIEEPLLGRTQLWLKDTAFRLEIMEESGDLEVPGMLAVTPGMAVAPTALYANSEAGIVRLQDVDSEEGRLVAPSHGIKIEPYFAYSSFWYVSNPDTVLSVPAGDFRCVETTWWETPNRWFTYYWADRVGLVAHQSRQGDPRAGPVDRWLEVHLIEVRTPRR
jgi:hypothetical protein